MTLPNWSDPRFRLAAVTIALQVLGQTVLGFQLSLPQIVVTIAFCATLELAVTYWRRRVVVWPSSAILTGNSIALFLRATGTHHGDWWSLQGIEYFLLAATIGLLSKYLVRWGGQHIYNPSNIGLVAVLLLAGPTRVFPQPLWWGPMDLPVALAWGVIVLGGIWVLWRLGMIPMVTTFLIAFTTLIAIFAAQGQCFSAVWRATPVCGPDYWIGIAASPEVAIFVLLMMSDPRTAPAGPIGRAIYGAATALVAAALIYPQQAEWGIKLALLAALTIVCSFVPLIERLEAGLISRRLRIKSPTTPPARLRPTPGLVAAALVALALTLLVPSGVLAAAADPRVVEADRPGAAGAPTLQQ
ncbi:MAG: hypothetical protein WBD38_01850 [Candidatus Dormiibacterota bacterium]